MIKSKYIMKKKLQINKMINFLKKIKIHFINVEADPRL
jgi:hypothetical protein